MPENKKIAELFNQAGIPSAPPALVVLASAWFSITSLSNPEEVTTEPVYDRKELPPRIRDFLDGLEGMDQFSKMQRIHQFTVDVMEYGDNPLFISTFAEILGDYSVKNPDGAVQWKGACRDFTVLEASLLRHAGFKDDQIAIIFGKVDYELASGKRLENLDHAITVVNIGGKTYALDQNTREPAEIGADLTYEGILIAAARNDAVIDFGAAEVTRINWARDFDGGHWAGSKPKEARASDIAAFNKAEAHYNNRHRTHEGSGGPSGPGVSHNGFDPAEDASIKEAYKVLHCLMEKQGGNACLEEAVPGNIPNAKGNVRQR
jgi:hypothetical protein